jgi:hypothetical protein
MYGSSIAILSPLSVFFIAYSLFSLVRPFFYQTFDNSYAFTNINQSDYLLSLFIIAITNWFLCLGYIIATNNKQRNIIYTSKKQPTPLILVLVLLFLFPAYYHAITNGLLTLDFGSNRTNYLISLQGSGYVTLLYGSPGFYLLWYYWSIGNRKPCFLFILLIFSFLFLNSFVSNRSSLTIVLYGFIFLWQLKKKKEDRIGAVLIITILVLIVFAGTTLGIARNFEDMDYGSMTLLFLGFLSATFDMHEMFSHVLSTFSLDNLYLGMSWFQDIFYTYLPRSIFEFKPQYYGSTLLQVDILGRDPSKVMGSSFPLGIYSEGYVNFWYFGVFFAMVFIGYALGFFFTKAINYCSNGPNLFNFWPLLIYLATSANTLGYLRSFGQYIAGTLFSLLTFLITAFTIWILWKVIRAVS